MKKGEKTTYALFAAEQEKEKGRNSFEDGVYAVFTLMTVLAIWQFAAVAKPLPKALGASVHHRVHKAHFAAGSRPG
jgi:hypothetical protein